VTPYWALVYTPFSATVDASGSVAVGLGRNDSGGVGQPLAVGGWGSAWTQASPPQQKEFIRLFSTLIANAYLSRIEQFAGEPFTYVGEKIDGEEASVQSRVVTSKGSELGLEYRMYRADGRWAVYDIYVDGISLVGSYKAQFNRIIQRGSFADLLKQLRLKAGS